MEQKVKAVTTDASVVYMTKDISSDALLAIYDVLGREANGKNIAVKISSGEPGGHNFLNAQMIKALVLKVNGTFVECNTAYGGLRAKTEDHRKAATDHGFMDYTTMDIMDAEGEMQIPIANGKHLKEDLVGAHLANYDFMVVLSHFKGHAMGGFGGAIKNIAIGVASSEGKLLIHGAGKKSWDAKQDDFLESMAEAASAVTDYFGDKILYINVMNRLSIDCDCDSNPAEPDMDDIGILASLDPVALDQACVDLVYAAKDGASLIERMESRHGIHTLEYAEKIGMGNRKYQLVHIDQ